MKTFMILGLSIFIHACANNQNPGENRVTKTEEELVSNAFQDIEIILDGNTTQFWGIDLIGPMILVNPDTRYFYTKKNYGILELEAMNGFYKGILPEDINIANTAFDWNGMRWSMVMLPLPEDKTDRNRLLIHESFHRIQQELGLEIPEAGNDHLDTYDGRVLLKLELEALKHALIAVNKKEKGMHISNALLFRANRQKSNELKLAENSLELNEGLAEYTAIMLAGGSKEDIRRHFQESIARFYKNETFVRSFAYQTVPLYGYMLSGFEPDWHKQISKSTILTDLFMDLFKYTFPNDLDFQHIIENGDYNYQLIVDVEKTREAKRLAIIIDFEKRFLQDPVLKIPNENMNFSFDPRNIIPLEDHGTVYPTMRVTDAWGILTVENGALLGADWGHILVDNPVQIGDSLATGNGWRLEIYQGWKIDPVEDSFVLKRN